MYTAVAGLNTFNEALSVVSDNIANANTTGFKSNTVDFGDLVSGLIATADNNTRRRALARQCSALRRISRPVRKYRPGPGRI